jgi:hypothetical protein
MAEVRAEVWQPIGRDERDGLEHRTRSNVLG